MMKRTLTYAGIGARKTPEEVCKMMSMIAIKLERLGYTLNSGGADGADSAFAREVKKKQIFIPWRGFNNITTPFDTPTEYAKEISRKFHPAYNKLKYAGSLLMARNSHIILGPDCRTPVDFVICWTEGGKEIGGTAQGLRIAKHYRIPIYNLAKQEDVEKLSAYISSLELENESSNNI